MGALFDELSFVRKLEDGGTFSRPQAERLSEALHDVVGESVATKLDLAEVRTEVGHLRMDLKADLAAVRNEVRASLAETKVWTVSVGATIIAVLAAMKYSG